MKQLFYAFRYIVKMPGAQLVKVVSLTLGLTVGLLIFAKVAFENSYDNFFPDSERVYQMKGRFSINDGNKMMTQESDMLFGPMAPLMMQEIPQIESATRTAWLWDREYFYNNEFFEFATIMADTCLFDVLDYGMVQGDPKDLRAWDHALISESAAKIIFGGENPIGNTILFDKKIPLTIRGIFRDVPRNSQVKFDIILSLEGIKQIAGWGSGAENWNGGDSFRTYTKLRPGASIREVEESAGILMANSPIQETVEKWGISFLFRPIAENHKNDYSTRQLIRIMLPLAFLVLFISAMNYVLVSISSLDKRTKAIAVQKCNGSGSGSVFGQFLIETALLILVSLLLTVILFLLFRQQIYELTGETLATLFVPRQWWIMGAVVAGFFLLSGVIPGRIFSRIPVTHAFKALPAEKRWWKQLLLFFQLLCASFVLVFLLIVVRQYNRVANRDLGYNPENVATLYMKNVNSNIYERIRQELLAEPFVESMAYSNAVLTDGLSGEPIQIPGTDEVFSSRRLAAEPGFLELMKIPLKYGEYFPEQDYRRNRVIVNEKLVEMLGWEGNPVGKRLHEEHYEGGVEIIGVARDFHASGSATSALMPIIIYSSRMDTTKLVSRILHIRLQEINPENLSSLHARLEKLLPDQKMILYTYPEFLYETSSLERMIRNLVAIAAVIITLISLIGLIGYVNDEVRRKRREIAIRKVHGATVPEIIRIIARSLMIVGTIAIVCGTAGAWPAASFFLQSFPIRIPLSAWIFIGGALFVLFICIATIVLRSWRAANANPAGTIKSE